MDPNTGRLRALSGDESSMLSMMQDAKTAVEENILEELRGLEPLPEELHKEAEKELDGKKETYVDLKSDSSLAKWARKRRAESAQKRRAESAAKKKKKRRKTAKQSQKINRKK
jgi:hypothetical protein